MKTNGKWIVSGSVTSTQVDASIALAANVIATSQKGAANGVATLDANSLVPITQIPPAALERLIVVADQAARFALTTATAQNGDTVKQTDTGILYFVSDDTQLNGAGGYTVYTAGTASSVAWSGVTGTPTTLSGYGITDAVSSTLASAKILVGNGSALATAVDMSGEATIANTGAVTLANSAVIGKVLTGFSAATGGTVAATDSILAAFGRLENRTALNDAKVSYTAAAARSDLIASSISDGDTTHAPDGNSVFDALALKLDSSAFTAAAVTGKVLTGFSAATGGTVVATDTILEGIGRLENRTALNDAKVSYTAAAARSDLIASSISDGDTTHSPDGNSVFDALALKQAIITFAKESLTILTADITAGFKDMAQVVIAGSVSISPVGGPVQTEGTDYTISLTGGVGGKSRVLFTGGGDLAALLANNDIVVVSYSRL